jgi:hypothetical protein
MRIEKAQAKRGSNNGLSGAWMSLVLAAGVLLSLKAPTKVATSFVEVGKPETVEFVASAPDDTSPAETIAESSTLDLQLD